MDEELLTIQEYSRLRGVTPEATYKRVRKGLLNDYLVLQDGRKMLMRKLLEDEAAQPVTQPATRETTNPPGGSICCPDEMLERLNTIEAKLDRLLELLAEEPSETKGAALPEPPKPERTP